MTQIAGLRKAGGDPLITPGSQEGPKVLGRVIWPGQMVALSVHHAGVKTIFRKS